MPKPKILIVDDEYLIRWSLSENLQKEGYRCVTSETGEEALELFRTESPDLVLLDIKLPGIDGIQVLQQIKETDPDTPVLMITATTQVEVAVKAMKLGAYDYVSKPFDLTEIQTKVRHALETTQLREEVAYFRSRHAHRLGFDGIIAGCPRMQEVLSVARRVARSSSTTVLLTGESGTGKDVLARAIHYESPRADRPFMPINCTALPEELLESELMGYEKGAFTDAKKTKKGLFELADGGTIFLDEIGDMKLGLQSKLLRFLEDRSFKRIGGKEDIEVDVRIIAATNADLERAIEEKRFREDLFYRLSVVPIVLPPLRDRQEDILPLAYHFLEMYNREFKTSFRGFSAEAEAFLTRYDWPGNIRELRNVVERAVILSTGDEIGVDALPWKIKGGERAGGARRPDKAPQPGVVVLPDHGVDIEEVERELIVQALEKTGNNQTRAAKMLGLTRDALRYRMKKYDLL
ncbi:MAG: sigma-54-dependent Fis family transcriptional regulator [Deltaproteobacteria bacterium]|nr:sigma-54-dependent Fis family transcriptional regulator [Deltaproteobacteria bacterium]